MSTTTFNDIFKSSFLENITSISVTDMLITIILAFGIGVFIAFVYKKTYRGVMYSSGFATTLIALTVITSIVILAVTSNVVLSLGMVGALSIVRFRTAIKDPLDIVFLFWAIGEGIILAAGMIPLAVIGAVCVGLILLVFVNKRIGSSPYMVVVNCDGHDAEVKAKEIISKNTERMRVKSKTASKGSTELDIEVRLKSDDTDFISAIADLEGVASAVIVSYNGDYMG